VALTRRYVALNDELFWLIGEFAAWHVAIAALVTVHILLYKRNVAASVSWIGIAWLSPFLGALLYVTMGINRVKRRAQRLRRQRLPMAVAEETLADAAAKDPLTPLEFAIGRLTGLPSEPGNKVEALRNGDEAYPRMLEEIGRAQMSIGLQSYIFRDDAAGAPFHLALIEAQRRGVQVRVLIDGVGGGYFWSGTYRRLSRAGVPVARFLHSYFPWRMPFVNLRNHRKVLVIDGRIGFAGGINIGAENLQATHPTHACGTHFREGQSSSSSPTPSSTTGCLRPADLPARTGSRRSKRRSRDGPGGDLGPDEDNERIEFVALHAIPALASQSRGDTHFLPPEPLTMALGLAACAASNRPDPSERSNRDLDGRGEFAPATDQADASLAAAAVRALEAMTIDDCWSFVGSANWDTRSFRLNFG
jgi:cardiolipin synthase